MKIKNLISVIILIVAGVSNGHGQDKVKDALYKTYLECVTTQPEYANKQKWSPWKTCKVSIETDNHNITIGDTKYSVKSVNRTTVINGRKCTDLNVVSGEGIEYKVLLYSSRNRYEHQLTITSKGNGSSYMMQLKTKNKKP